MTTAKTIQAKAAADIARLTHGAPLLAACTVPFTEVRMALLNEIDAYTNQWVERQKQSAADTCTTAKVLAGSGGTDPMDAMRILAEWCSAEMARAMVDLREGTALMALCGAGIVKGAVTSGVVEIKTAEVVLPTLDDKHSAPV